MTKRVKLFCLPYAGGSANIYNKWSTELSESIELCPIELAGRGRRITERPYDNLEEAVDDIYNIISKEIETNDYAIFGHSMGAFLGYELIQKIKAKGQKGPIHTFFSGRRPPGVPKKTKLFCEMSPAEFEEAVLALGGTPPEFFEYPELKRIFIPLLRSDFSISETVVDRPQIMPLPCNISVLLGETEGISPEVAAGWHAHTMQECDINYIPGGHFFLLDQHKAVIEIVNEKLVQSAKEVTI